MIAHPTVDNAMRRSKLKLQPMMRSIPAVQAHFPQRPRDMCDSLFFKERADGLASLLITGANSPASNRQRTLPGLWVHSPEIPTCREQGLAP